MTWSPAEEIDTVSWTKPDMLISFKFMDHVMATPQTPAGGAVTLRLVRWMQDRAVRVH